MNAARSRELVKGEKKKYKHTFLLPSLICTVAGNKSRGRCNFTDPIELRDLVFFISI